MSARTIHHIVCTAGVSVFNDRNVFGKLARSCGAFEFPGSAPVAIKSLSHADSLALWRKALEKTAIDPTVKPTSVSAEYSLLHALRVARRLGDRPRVVLIHTDTLAGEAAAMAVGTTLEKGFGASIKHRPAVAFDVRRPDRLQRSLGVFMEAVARELSGQEPSVTCFAPVGGYKVMTSLGYLAGAYLG